LNVDVFFDGGSVDAQWLSFVLLLWIDCVRVSLYVREKEFRVWQRGEESALCNHQLQ
jgi:hypothetical protein